MIGINDRHTVLVRNTPEGCVSKILLYDFTPTNIVRGGKQRKIVKRVWKNTQM